MQGFVGALHGQQSDQGVFITTGNFSAGARQYAETVASRVILIDGQRLARLMIRYHVGVQGETEPADRGDRRGLLREAAD